jgi:hypothetical protein
MISIFMRNEKSEHSPVLLDPHTTSPGANEEAGSAIVRNSPRPVIEIRQTEIYTKARSIYTRGRRASMVRGVGII